MSFFILLDQTGFFTSEMLFLHIKLTHKITNSTLSHQEGCRFSCIHFSALCLFTFHHWESPETLKSYLRRCFKDTIQFHLWLLKHQIINLFLRKCNLLPFTINSVSFNLIQQHPQSSLTVKRLMIHVSRV